MELLTSLHSTDDAYRLEYCFSDRLLGLKVYPRVCGGTEAMLRLMMGVSGLSPRVRGNPSRTVASVFAPGSIPACAGEPGVPWERG